jgi:hypothetical protein
LYTFIKVPGAMGLENSRPVGLLEILQKASYAFDFAAITFDFLWKSKGLLHDSQYAFRAKKGTEGPLLLWSMMNDRAYLRKEDQARGQGDLKHAYDGVQQWATSGAARGPNLTHCLATSPSCCATRFLCS